MHYTAPDTFPSNLTGVSDDSSSITLSWDEPDGRLNGILRAYWINITEVPTGDEFSFVTTTTSIVINNLHPYYTYLWRVAAVTVNEGPYSALQSITTMEDGNTLACIPNDLLVHFSLTFNICSALCSFHDLTL